MVKKLKKDLLLENKKLKAKVQKLELELANQPDRYKLSYVVPMWHQSRLSALC